ncbi:interleukin-31 receptor subunit alpha isoform X2 [Dicentrarchus labrax]|uniref:interleukin-31 receptor subunit alpha isoform X2 n=1 Tax=Dicentrarchus labrax TaxID=13489 RepID=UPI0021F5D7C9|nr:interleukin-31 receptor subunit alpha isoform X2 [Dicentrarchus labrax]
MNTVGFTQMESVIYIVLVNIIHVVNKTVCGNLETTQQKRHTHSSYNSLFENSESTNCTKAVFRGSPKTYTLRCGPPNNVKFSRHSGRLTVTVTWPQEDIKFIKYYSVRYKALGSLSWNKPPVQSQNGEHCTVDNLNSSLVYTVQIQCVTNEKCTQCVWSEPYTVPSELTTQPVIVNLHDTDIAENKGHRLLSLTWKYPAKEVHDGYNLTIRKASGEGPCDWKKTTHTEIRLILSYSSYHLNISAVNNASTSPVVGRIIPRREDGPSMGAGKLNVTVHSNSSFTIYWEVNLIRTYVCYSVEWMKKGHKAAYISFYEDKNNYRTISSLPEPLEPYKRYSITLHTRPNKDTCNMKHINNSESTYGNKQFYFIEGSPISAPTNISSHNVKLNSVVLQWSSIPEEDTRGFLLGYIIHYTEYHNRGTERNITVDPEFDSYELGDLESGMVYEVQISGFTQAGAGVRSTAGLFKTNNEGYSKLMGPIIIFAVGAIVLIFGSPIIKRAKVLLWPSIPNPGNSNAMQKIERPCELKLLESINILKVEEWDTNSLQILEKEEEVIPASTLTSLPLLHATEDEEDSSEIICNWFHRDAEGSSGDILPDITAETFSGIQPTDLQISPLAFTCGYTTMEMFQQGMLPNTPTVTQAMESKAGDMELTVVKSRLDYIRQFSTSPVLDNNEDISMIL